MDYELHPHPVGPWLLRVGGRSFAVDPSAGRRLRVEGPDPRLLAMLEASAATTRGRDIRLRLTLIPARPIAAIARAIEPLSGWPALAIQALFGIGVSIWAAAAGGLVRGTVDAADLIVATWLLLILNLVHEFGHAAALSRGGYPPGRIGFGWLLLLPVLFCDVSAVALLERGDRIRVDIAGICTQIAGIGWLLLLGAALETPAPGLAAFGGMISVAWGLLPVMKVDGYWLLCDVLGLDALDGPPPPGKERIQAVARAAYRLLLVLVGLRMAVFAIGLVRRLCALAPGLKRPAACAAGLLLLPVIVALAIRAFRARRRNPSDPRA